MASGILKFNLQLVKTSSRLVQLQPTRTSPSLPYPAQKHHHHSYLYLCSSKPLYTTKISPLPVHSSLSSPTPPSSKEEAVLQAKTSLSTTLAKPLNNPKLSGKLKKVKQPRLRVEIPVIEDSLASLIQLGLEVFGEMSIRRKGSSVKILILWPNCTLTAAAMEAFSRSSNSIQHLDIPSVLTNGDTRILNSADVAVFLAPEASQLGVIKTVTESLYPRPMVIFNPTWGFEEESSFDELSSFVGSFEVVYSFMGLEVRGVLSKTKGVVFKCVRDGVLSGEKWNVLVEEGGQLKVVSRLSTRPSITEVENVLYNVMAVNSPITKSAKFLKDLVSNVTGKK